MLLQLLTLFLLLFCEFQLQKLPSFLLLLLEFSLLSRNFVVVFVTIVVLAIAVCKYKFVWWFSFFELDVVLDIPNVFLLLHSVVL